VKIRVNQIPEGGVILEETRSPGELDLETEVLKFRGPVKIRAEVSKVTNAVTVYLTVNALMQTSCSRCLEDFQLGFKKTAQLNYLAEKSSAEIDLDPDIREEIILDYSMQPLCRVECKGLCPKCGKNLNQGGCSCGTTKKKAF